LTRIANVINVLIPSQTRLVVAIDVARWIIVANMAVMNLRRTQTLVAKRKTNVERKRTDE
jgi:hypothetical protein